VEENQGVTSPRSLKALDRLIGAAVDIPVAWLNQQKAKIDSQTKAFESVESAIAEAAGRQAVSDAGIVERATQSLIRKAYKKQSNLEAVSVQAIHELKKEESTANNDDASIDVEVDIDWLNVFERFAEDASSARMQNLWGRILAGEIRKPGQFSLRTLRYISEISQREASQFSNISQLFFAGKSPWSLINPDSKEDISDLLFLEENGLIQGSSGLGLSHSQQVPDHGFIIFYEKDIALALKAEPGKKLSFSIIVLTVLGQELIKLISERDLVEIASKVAEAYKTDEIEAAYIFPCDGNVVQTSYPIRVLWER
jgi:hypothetical protein